MFEIHEAIEGVSMKGPMEKNNFKNYKRKINSRKFND
jgi:hypothetical protein